MSAPVEESSGDRLRAFAGNAPVSRNFAANLLLSFQRGKGENGRPEVRLLTVREAATLLRVSTATIYRLCERGDLRHMRVSNSIRVIWAREH
jgi:excisionase family DNA binding protein